MLQFQMNLVQESKEFVTSNFVFVMFYSSTRNLKNKNV